MVRGKAISNRLLLGAIVFGLNILCFLGISHGYRGAHHTRVNLHVPHHSSRKAGSSRSDSDSVAMMVEAYFDHSIVDHTPQASLSTAKVHADMHDIPTALLSTPLVFGLEDRTEPLAEENVMAVGSAPRAPGLGRAPPLAA